MEPMDRARFEKIKAGCEKIGINILQNEEAICYLDHSCAEALTFNEDTILFRKNPTASAVFEELIHATQYKKKKIDGSSRSRILAEIEAKKKLIKYKKAYGITDEEDLLTQKQLKSCQKELYELGDV